MEVISLAQLALMSGVRPNDNMKSVQVSLNKFAAAYGLDRPHRLAQYLPQIMHEGGNFRFDTEIWGPTPAQKRYEDRKDLGHSTAVAGEAEKFKGRTSLQATGRDNYRNFTAWCKMQGYDCPDFEKNPELINTDPWEGLFPVYYWATGNPTHSSLNRYADEGDIEQITKSINGGLNGFDDRLKKYTCCALVLLQFEPDDVKGFQRQAQEDGLLPKDEPGKPSQVDGDVGPRTRSALHMALVKLDGRSAVSTTVKAAPVVQKEVVIEEKQVRVPVTGGAEKRGMAWIMGAIGIVSPAISTFAAVDLTTKLLFGGVGIVAIAFLMWRGEMIAARVKKVVEAFSF